MEELHGHVFIGDSYYCDSDELTNYTVQNDQTMGWPANNFCTGPPGTNSSPPQFIVQLPAPTTDMIQVSICCDRGTGDEDIPIRLLEICVQQQSS